MSLAIIFYSSFLKGVTVTVTVTDVGKSVQVDMNSGKV
jgi:hypothetical protein